MQDGIVYDLGRVRSVCNIESAIYEVDVLQSDSATQILYLNVHEGNVVPMNAV